jgi:hypothetical protein
LLLPNDSAARRKADEELKESFGLKLKPGQQGNLEMLYEQVKSLITYMRQHDGLEIREVYITGYTPGLFRARMENGEMGFKTCGVFEDKTVVGVTQTLGMSEADAQDVYFWGSLLNALIKEKAEVRGSGDSEPPWHYIDVAADFDVHGYCASKEDGTFFVGAEESCLRQGDFDGVAHPNHLGQTAYGFRIAEAIRRHTPGLGKRPFPGSEPRTNRPPIGSSQ